MEDTTLLPQDELAWSPSYSRTSLHMDWKHSKRRGMSDAQWFWSAPAASWLLVWSWPLAGGVKEIRNIEIALTYEILVHLGQRDFLASDDLKNIERVEIKHLVSSSTFKSLFKDARILGVHDLNVSVLLLIILVDTAFLFWFLAVGFSAISSILIVDGERSILGRPIIQAAASEDSILLQVGCHQGEAFELFRNFVELACASEFVLEVLGLADVIPLLQIISQGAIWEERSLSN